MKNIFYTAISLLVFTIGVPLVSAQASDCGCQAALNVNLLSEVRYTLKGGSQAQSIGSFCKAYKSGSRYSVKFLDVSVGYGREIANALCRSRHDSSSSATSIDYLERGVSNELANAFNECQRACSRNDFNFDVKHNSDTSFSINFYKQSRDVSINDLILTPYSIIQNDKESFDEGKVECELASHNSEIILARAVGDKKPENFPINLTDGNAAQVNCKRTLIENNDMAYYPGYTIATAIGNEQISQTISPSPLRRTHLRSTEYNELTGILHKFFDRQWANVTKNRALGTDFENKTPYPIGISIIAHQSKRSKGDDQNRCHIRIIINGTIVSEKRNNNGIGHKNCLVFSTVPPGQTYRAETAAHRNKKNITTYTWLELRAD